MGSGNKNDSLIKRYSLGVYPTIGVLVCIMLVQTGIQLLQPWPLSVAIDSVFGTTPAPGVVPSSWSKTTLLNAIALSSVALLILRSAVSYVDARISMWMNFKIDSAVRSYTLGGVLSTAQTDRTLNDGEYDYRINSDARAVADRVLGIRLSYVYSLVVFVLAAAVLLRLSVSLGLISIALTPLSLIPVKLLTPSITRANKQIKEKSSDIRSHVIESVSQARTIQLFAKESAQVRRFGRLMRENYQLGIRKHNLSFAFGLFENISSTVAGAVILLVGGHQVLNGALSAGELIVFLGYRSMLTEPLDNLVSTINEQKSADISIERVEEVLAVIGHDTSPNENPEKLSLHYPIHGEVTFSNVTVTRGGKHILDNIDLTITPGEKVAIIGPSGSGKSTFINLLPRFMLLDGGRITVDGQDISTISLFELRNLFSFVDQNPELFSLSVEENIAFGTPDFVQLTDKSFIADVALVSDAFDFIMKLPDTFNSKLGSGSVSLSGGQKQRIAIARALAKNSPIIILDEPTSALDDASAHRVLSHIGASFAGRTTIVVTHSMQLLDMMDSVYELKNGKLTKVNNYKERIKSFSH